MSVPTLEIKELSCKVEQKTIIKGVNLTLRGGEIHVIMGPNGTGKSTLASVLMGHPNFKVTGGEALLNGADLLSMSVDERARAGAFGYAVSGGDFRHYQCGISEGGCECRQGCRAEHGAFSFQTRDA